MYTLAKMETRRAYIILFFTLMTFTSSQAQHCLWDLSDIIIVDVRDGKTGEIVNGLDITLTDSIGIPYLSKYPRANIVNRFVSFQDSDTLKFGQNLEKVPQKLANFQKFPLCKGCYMLRASKGELQENYITIRDVDKKNNSNNFDTKIVKITSKNIVSLCRDNPIWRNIDSLNRIKVNVTLIE